MLIAFTMLSVTAIGAEPDEEQFCKSALEAQAARFSGMIAKDIVTLDELLLDELSYGHTSGWTESKTSFLSTIESKVIEYIDITPGDLKCQIYGEAAILTGQSAMNLMVRGQPLEINIRFLEVAYREDARWRLLAWQSVRLPDD